MTEKNRPYLVNQLLDDNGHFRSLHTKHQTLENQLRALDKRLYLTEDEQLQMNRLKKLKLKNKDLMEEMLSQYELSDRNEGTPYRP